MAESKQRSKLVFILATYQPAKASTLGLVFANCEACKVASPGLNNCSPIVSSSSSIPKAEINKKGDDNSKYLWKNYRNKFGLSVLS